MSEQKMRAALESLVRRAEECFKSGDRLNPNIVHAIARAALASQAAPTTEESSAVQQGEAVAEVTSNRPDNYSAGHRIKWITEQVFLPRTKLYTAPPAPSVPDARKFKVPVQGERPFSEREIGAIEDWNACRAAMLASGGKAIVPDGWKLVPLDPTDEMLSEVHKNPMWRCLNFDSLESIWADMLAAAPALGDASR